MADAAAYVSAAADHRRKKTALDKARANYLCSQLRLRLQYAKLKVDHGWQRQTLNEVENLYFRHAQRRRFGELSSGSSFYSASSSSLGSTPTLPYAAYTRSHPSPDPSSTQHASDPPASGVPTQQDQQSNAVPDSSKTSSPRSSASPENPNTPPTGDSPTPHKPGQTPPMASLSPSPPAPHHPDSAGFAPHPYAHYPARVLQYTPTPHPSAYAGGGYSPQGYSPQSYLAKAYVSSSPFPLNAPASPRAQPTALGAALTYDSFWSAHASWGVHGGQAVPAPNGPAGGVQVGGAVPVPPAGGGSQSAE